MNPAGQIVLGLATEAEREACAALAYQVFCEEVGALREKADHRRRLLLDDVIQGAEVTCVKVDGKLAGSVGILFGGAEAFPGELERGFEISRFASAVPRERMAVVVRLNVHPDHRGGLVPFRLIAAAARRLAERGVALAFCDCQPHLLPLYTSLGFRPFAPLFDQAGFGLMVPLVLITVDHDHLRAIRSPLLKCFPREMADPGRAAAIDACLPAEAPVQGADDLPDEAWARLFEVLDRPRAPIPATEGLAPEEIQEVLRHARILGCDRGRQVIVEGQAARTAYLVLEGTVEVRRHGRLLGTAGPGELVGEFALLLDGRRTADVVAASDAVRLAALDEKSLLRLIEQRSPVAARLLWNLARSLARSLADRALEPD